MLNFVCKAFFAPLFYFANCSAVTGYITFGFLFGTPFSLWGARNYFYTSQFVILT